MNDQQEGTRRGKCSRQQRCGQLVYCAAGKMAKFLRNTCNIFVLISVLCLATDFGKFIADNHGLRKAHKKYHCLNEQGRIKIRNELPLHTSKWM